MGDLNDQKLEEIRSILIREFNPKKIYLFGSRANGNHRSNSDYDLVVVVENSDLDRHDRNVKARLALFDVGAPVDVFVYTHAEFEDWKDEMSSIPETAYRLGRELALG
jgi:predicted nucleotidyltransferase